MSDLDFNALLDAPLESHEAPKPLPPGSYVAVVAGYEYGKAKNEKQTPFVSFKMALQEALPDVDAEQLAEALGDNPLNSKTMKHDLYLTGEAAFRLRKFLEEHLKIDGGMTTREAIDAAQGQSVVVNVEHRPNTRDPNGPPYVNIKDTAALPEN